MDTTLVVMAAGIGSRFGGGIKQLEPVGPGGEIIMDYSIHDALEAGFNKVVFIIRRDLEEDFRRVIGDRIAKIVNIEYAFQELTDVPDWYRLPAERVKPFGTGQAILSAAGCVHEPFAVINADDYYGKEGFRLLHDYMTTQMRTSGRPYDMCMAGFVLKNTLSDNGGVTRGVCVADENGYLTDIEETFEIELRPDGTLYAVDEKKNPRHVELDQIVSMNMWGLTPGFMDELREGFPEFLRNIAPDDIKSEYLLPSIIGDCIKTGRGSVKVLASHDRWFGVTYKADKAVVVDSIKKLVAQGVYPERLYM